MSTHGLPKRDRELTILVCLVIIALLAILFPPVITYGKNCITLTPLRISGSTALFPLVNQAAQAYKSIVCSPTINIESNSSSEIGLNKVHQGDVDIGTSDLFADPTDPNQGDLQDHQVAIVVFALVINKNAALSGITTLNTNQIRSIYGGAYRSWHDVDQGVSDTTLRIILVSRPITSGTRATFDQYVLKGLENVSGSQLGDTNEEVAQYVCKTPGAIGYISLYYYAEYQRCLQLLSINGQAPTLGGVINKQNPYTFWNIEHMYTKGQPGGFTRQFIAYMYSDTVKTYIKQDGYLDISNIPTDILEKHLSL